MWFKVTPPPLPFRKRNEKVGGGCVTEHLASFYTGTCKYRHKEKCGLRLLYVIISTRCFRLSALWIYKIIKKAHSVRYSMVCDLSVYSELLKLNHCLQNKLYNGEEICARMSWTLCCDLLFPLCVACTIVTRVLAPFSQRILRDLFERLLFLQQFVQGRYVMQSHMFSNVAHWRSALNVLNWCYAVSCCVPKYLARVAYGVQEHLWHNW